MAFPPEPEPLPSSFNCACSTGFKLILKFCPHAVSVVAIETAIAT
jgi:hypothetical protein